MNLWVLSCFIYVSTDVSSEMIKTELNEIVIVEAHEEYGGVKRIMIVGVK